MPEPIPAPEVLTIDPAMVRRLYRKRNPGGLWFERDTNEFFSSRLCQGYVAASGVIYFVTSERYDEAHPRLYSVRKMDAVGHITTVGPFQAYETRDAALAEARALAES